MKTADEGRIICDEELTALERKISRMYGQTAAELQKTIDEYFNLFISKEMEMQAMLEAGKITAEQFKQWKLAYIGRGRRFEELRDKLAYRVTHANEVAVSYINDKTPTIYTISRNYENYRIATAKRLEYEQWTLFNETTVRRLIMESPDLLPNYPIEWQIKRDIDLKYGQKQITSITTSAIIRGKSSRQIAAELRQRLTRMSVESSIKIARTALTAAENGGRQDSMERAAQMGIKLKKRWSAVKDLRTRPEHGKADGQTVDVDKPYTVGGEKLMFPGDAAHGASGHNIYNCRCLSEDDLDKELEAEKKMIRVRDLSGKNVVVEDMKYREYIEWLKKDPEIYEFTYKAERNKYTDAKQHEEYKKLLGRKAPSSFGAFQAMKYRRPEEWKELQALARAKRKEIKDVI
ncbi:phage minor head protein [Hominenteromicrobium sp.]|uniref:phage head morphogenesis protein n=1 Tax=Hominenteromicrobium sp. TaxID=3073581 RepID=UPI003994FCF9